MPKIHPANSGQLSHDTPIATHARLPRAEWLVLLLLCAFVLVLGILKGASLPLWSDELATVHIAGAPSWHEMLARGRMADLNPPLLPALVRISMGVLGPHELGARMPSILSFTVATAALFLLLIRRLTLPFATAGALLLVCSIEIRYYLTEARPYALLLAAVLTATLAYDSVLRGRRVGRARVVLALALVIMLQAHLFGSLAALAFVAAETVRTFRTRRLDVATAAALFLPWATCITYVPILHPTNSAPPLVYRLRDRASLHRALDFYLRFLLLPFTGLLKAALVIALGTYLLDGRQMPGKFRGEPRLWVLLLVLALTPLLVTCAFLVHSPGSGFYPRYAIAGVVPAVILFPELLAWLCRNKAPAGWLLVGILLVVFVRRLPDDPWHLRNVRQQGLRSQPAGFDSTGNLDALCPSLPLAMNNPLDFMEADFRVGPSAERRMLYVTDTAQAVRLEHDSAGESVSSMARAFQLAHPVVPSADFFAQHHEFLVLSRPAYHDWLLDLMAERRARVQPLGTLRFAGKESQLWYVDTNPAEPLPGCLTNRAALATTGEAGQGR